MNGIFEHLNEYFLCSGPDIHSDLSVDDILLVKNKIKKLSHGSELQQIIRIIRY